MHVCRHAHASPCHACEGQRATWAPGIDLSRAWQQATYPVELYLISALKKNDIWYVCELLHVLVCVHVFESVCVPRSWDSIWQAVSLPSTMWLLESQLRLVKRGPSSTKPSHQPWRYSSTREHIYSFVSLSSYFLGPGFLTGLGARLPAKKLQ